MKQNKMLERAMELTRLDAKSSADTNTAEVVFALKNEFGVSDYKARSIAAQAARRKRYTDFVKPRLGDDKIFTTPAQAARESACSYGTIARACALGQIEGAKQDGGGRWTFSLAAFNVWKTDPRYHQRGRRKKGATK